MKKVLYILPIFLFVFMAQNVFAAGVDDFMIVVETDALGGVSTDTQFTIPTTGIGYGYTVDCDDSGPMVPTGGQGGSYTCDYAAYGAGTYVIRIAGTFPQIYFNDGGDKTKIQGIHQWGTGAWRSMDSAFRGCSNLRITDDEAPILIGLTDMSRMFEDAINIGYSSGTWEWDTSSVTDMSFMFINATSFNEDITSWNVSNVTNMWNMLRSTTFNQDISGWDVEKVVNLAGLFMNTPFNQDISGWTINTNLAENVSMSWMFSNAPAFNQNISGWDTSRVTSMQNMFENAIVFNQSIGNWDTGNVTTMSFMFEGAIIFNQSLGNWDVSNISSLGGFLVDSGISVKNYDSTVVGWNALPLLQDNVYLEVDSDYCSTSAQAARANMISSYRWIFDDGEVGVGCPPPLISETTQITTPTTDTTPDYIFNTDEAGIITYEGSCSSATTAATTGDNTITLNELAVGTYSNCTITVTDSSTNVSNTLNISEFTIESGKTPIYRLYNTKTGVHLYTKGATDRDKIVSKWSDFEYTDGGAVFYASLSDDGNTPIYRLYNTKTGVHLYTKGATDRDKILSKWSDFEYTDGGAAFYLQVN